MNFSVQNCAEQQVVYTYKIEHSRPEVYTYAASCTKLSKLFRTVQGSCCRVVTFLKELCTKLNICGEDAEEKILGRKLLRRYSWEKLCAEEKFWEKIAKTHGWRRTKKTGS